MQAALPYCKNLKAVELENNFQGGLSVSKKFKILNVIICLFRQSPIFLCVFYLRQAVSPIPSLLESYSSKAPGN